MDESVEASERVKPLNLDDDGFFTLIRDIEATASRPELQTGARMKLIDLELVGRTMYARIRPKHHDAEDTFLIALDRLF